jgi:aldehyde dehydrogenase (NAD+)
MSIEELRHGRVVQHGTVIYINGAWVVSSSDETIDVENPATEQLIASVPSATAADVDVAVTAARAADGR